VLLQKPRSSLETYNDLDGNVVNFFRVLRDRPNELIRKIHLTPWAEREYSLFREITYDDDCIEWARKFFYLCWMSISGGPRPQKINPKSGFSFSKIPPGSFGIRGSHLARVSDRFLDVQIMDRSAVDIIALFNNDDSLIYFDPPYTRDGRAHKDLYGREFSEGDHVKAAASLRAALGYVVVSGYACPLYTELYEAHGWQRVDKEAQTNSGGKRIESLWLSPRTVDALQKPTQAVLFATGAR
jgi:DNA adenine methylase